MHPRSTAVRHVAVVLAAASLGVAGCAGAAPQPPTVAAAGATASTPPDGVVPSATDDPVPATVLDLLADDGRFTTFLELYGDMEVMRRAGWDNTLFAPPDEAFDALGDDVLATLRSDEAARHDLLQRHITGGRQRPAEMGAWLRSGTARTPGSGSMTFELRLKGYEYELVWGGATVVEQGLEAANGLVHVVDAIAEWPAGS